jgi:membrane fusion protein (multidrug efflux system)
MKNKILFLTLTILVVACGSPDKNKELTKLKTDLEKLRKDRSELDSKIAKIEEQVAKIDTTKKEKTTEVVAVPLKPKDFKTYIEVQGRVDADESVSLSSEIPGTITKIHVKVGDHVTNGQVLAETDARAVQQQLTAMQANLALATQAFEKQKNLWNQKIGTEMMFLQTKTNKEALESQAAALQEQLRMSKIISPIDGTVDMMNLKIGQAVSPGQGVISVVNFSNLKVKAEVAEKYSSRVKNGNEALIVFPDMEDSITSKVHYASRGINALTRTFGVEMLLDTKKEYHPNMVAKVKINDYKSETPKIVVPIKYIQKGTTESFVMVAEKGKAVKKPITITHEYSGNAEIASGLKDGDLLITEGYDLVNEGDSVTVKEPAH